MTSHVTFQQGVKECIPTLLGYIGRTIIWHRGSFSGF